MRRSTKQWVEEALKRAGEIAIEIVIVIVIKRLKGKWLWK